MSRGRTAACILSLVLLALIQGRSAFAGSTGAVDLFTHQGSVTTTAQGEYLMSTMNAPARYFIEVPPGLARLSVELFDADIGLGGAGEEAAGRDRGRGAFVTSARYSLIDPSGNVQATLIGNSAGPAGSDNNWISLYNSVTPAAGHWELRVDMTGQPAGGDDINALGIRASDGDATSGGTELNVYYDSIGGYGTNPPTTGQNTRTYTNYPYLTAGCSASKNDFDWDSNSGNTGGLDFSDRTGAFTQNYASGSMSTNDLPWRRDTFTGWTSDTNATGYGLWTMGVTISSYISGGVQNGNYGHVYMGRFNVGANPPGVGANPVPNSFRVYFQTDGGAKPVEPYVEQQLRHGGSPPNGPNPPVAGTESRFTVTVRVVNPTPQAITFSATNLVTANVPGGGVVYGGNAQVSQGGAPATPALGGTGNITWNPGTVAAGATAILAYRVRVTPPSAARVVVTGTPAANGTTASFVDETGNTTQARATYTFGPLCELAVTPALLTPVVVSGLRTIATPEGVAVEWNTVSEVGAAGFDLYRWDAARRKWLKVNERLIPALVGAPQGGRYQVLDPAASASRRYWYLLKETETAGPGRAYGPYDAAPASESEATASALTASETDAPRKPSVKMLDALAQRQLAEASRAAQRRGPLPALKLGVREDGVVFVSSETLATHFGLSLADTQARLGSRRFNLTSGGRRLAWLPASEGRGLLFYGQGLDSTFSSDNVYWVRLGAGLAMNLAGGAASGPGPLNAAFADTVRAEEDHLAATVVATDPHSDYWFWDYLSAGDPAQDKKSFPVTATDVAAGGSAVLRVELAGATTTGVANEHHVLVRLNGSVVGETRWTGITARTLELPVAGFLLQEGVNTVELEALLEPGVAYSVLYVEGFEIAYARQFVANDSALAFRGDGLPDVTVAGFADASVLVLDIANPLRPRRLDAAAVENASGSYRVTLAPASAETPYFAASESGWHAPAWTEGDQPSSLRKSGGAAYVIVTTADLVSTAERLAALRSSSGLSTLVVDIQDVRDEFADGLADPDALRAFVRYAGRHWSTPPKYVLLAGRGHFDYKDNLGLGGNLVPPIMVATPKGLFASDTRLGDVSGKDGVPEIAVGRVPVLSAAELDAYIDKLEAYENAPVPDAARAALLLADKADGETDFAAGSEQIASSLPEGYTASRVYLESGVDIAIPRAELFALLDGGADLVNYVGHGALDRLAAEGLLTSSDALGLENMQTPVLSALSCTINRFEVPGFAPLGEELIKRPGAGFAAVWAPTGLSNNDEAGRLGRAFYHDLASLPGSRLGDAITRAIASYAKGGGFQWMPDIYALLGDPALPMKPGVVVPADDPGGSPKASEE